MKLVLQHFHTYSCTPCTEASLFSDLLDNVTDCEYFHKVLIWLAVYRALFFSLSFIYPAGKQPNLEI